MEAWIVHWRPSLTSTAALRCTNEKASLTCQSAARSVAAYPYQLP